MKLIPYTNAIGLTRHPHFKSAEKVWTIKTEDSIEDEAIRSECWVTLNHIDGFAHVKIFTRDGDKVEDFSIFQKVKDLVLGEDAVAVQIYPAQSDLVDGSNTYHLWSWEGLGTEAPNLKTMPRYS